MTTVKPAPIDNTFALHPAMQLGHVHYTVADLVRQIDFYCDHLGFKLNWRENGSAGLGVAGTDLLRLTELRGARHIRGTTGLYHTAFLVPSRWELAHLLRQIAACGRPIQGMVNHRTHLAIYLPDAEGNGIELAWDFPQEQWPDLTTLISAGNLPLYPEELLAELQRDPSPWNGLDAATKVGHVHLHVSDLPIAERFYGQIMGFDTLFVNERFQAAFFSTDSYHHHLGTNVWNGTSAPPPPPDARGLRYFTIGLPNADELAGTVEHIQRMGVATETTEQGVRLQDPFQNGILLTDLSAR